MAILKFRDADGKIHEVIAIKGNGYVLTEADKEEIAELVMQKLEDSIPSAEEVNY